MDFKPITDDIIRLSGGVENIKSLTHCMTRLRFVLKDDHLADLDAIRDVETVIGAVFGAGQLQVIMGKNLLPAYNEIMKNYDFGDEQAVSSRMAQKRPHTLKEFGTAVINYMGGSVSSMIVGLIAGGMLKILLLLVSLVFTSITKTSTYELLTFISDVPFYYMPVLVALGAAKKLGANPIYAVLVALTLLYPDFVKLAGNGGSTHIFGLPVLLVTYSSTFLPVLLSTFAVYYLERFYEKVIPDLLKPILIGMCTITTAVIITWVVFGPIAIYFGNYFIGGLVWLQSKIGPLAIAIMAGLMPFLVMTGMHTLFAPFMIQSLSVAGFDGLLRPTLMLHNMSEGAACLGIALRTKNRDLRTEAYSLAFGCVVAGVSEPALYGLMLRYKKPLYGVVAGGAVGGLVSGILGAKAYIMGRSSILALPIFKQTIPAMLIGIAAAMATAFIVTYVLGIDEEPIKKTPATKTTVDTNLLAITDGRSFPITDVHDDVFSTKMMGDGIAFEPGQEIVAPCAGTITSVISGGHAYGITRDDGVELLIHIGIDTVSLKGKGFNSQVQQGDQVLKGQILTTLDLAYLKTTGLDLTTMLIVLDSKGKTINFESYGSVTENTTPVLALV